MLKKFLLKCSVKCRVNMKSLCIKFGITWLRHTLWVVQLYTHYCCAYRVYNTNYYIKFREIQKIWLVKIGGRQRKSFYLTMMIFTWEFQSLKISMTKIKTNGKKREREEGRESSNKWWSGRFFFVIVVLFFVVYFFACFLFVWSLRIRINNWGNILGLQN